MQKNKIIYIATILTLITTLTMGCGKKPIDQDAIQQTPVEIQQLKNGNMQVTYSVSGRIKPFSEVAIFPKVPGKIENTFKDIGDKVAKDDVLFILDKQDLRRQLQQIDAQLASSNTSYEMAALGLEKAAGSGQERQLLQAESGLNQAKAGVDQANAGMSQAEEGINRAESALKQTESGLKQIEIKYNSAKSDYEKNKSLYEAGAISQQAIDNYKRQLEIAEIEYRTANENYTTTKESYNNSKESYNNAIKAYENAQNNYTNAEQNYNITKDKAISEDIKGAKLQTEQAKGASAVTRVQKETILDAINDSNVKSPISGIIAAKNIETGGLASQQMASYTVVDIDSVIVEASVTERMVNKLSKGQQVIVTVKSLDEKRFNGVIDALSSASIGQQVGYTVKIVIENIDHEIKPGMFAEVGFIIESKENIISVPMEAVLSEGVNNFVYVVDGDKAKKREIVIGLKDESNYEVISGLEEGEKVIIKGQHFINDDQQVRLVGGDEQ